MKPIAKRLSLIQPSATLAITAMEADLKAQGKNIVSFGAGEPDFDTPLAIKQAAKMAIDAGKTKYTAIAGTNDLKDAIIHKLKRDNHVTYTRNEIIVSNGGKQCLFNLMMAIVEEGDEVILPSPYWVTYPEQIRVFGGKPVIIPTSDASQFKITAGQLKNALGQKTRAVILNSPSNPTGSTYTKKEVIALAQVCVENGVYLISDEIYEHIVYDGFEHYCPAAHSPEVKDNTIVINGASKCYAMTGWRMGFAAGPAHLIKAMDKLQSQSTSNVCSITQAACVEAFSGPLEEVGKMVTAFKERRNYLVSKLKEIPGITCLNPAGAFYVFPNITALFGKKTPAGKLIQSSDDFCLYLLEDFQVSAVPGSAFGAEGYVRLSYATGMDSIREGVNRIARAVGEIKNKS